MNAELDRIVREELWRSVAWFGLAIVGWPTLADEVPWLDVNAITVFVLPVLTWVVLTAGTVGLRVITARELQVQTVSGWILSAVLGFVLSGVGAVYLVTIEGYDPLLVGAMLAFWVVAPVLWWRYRYGRPYPEYLE